MKILPVRHPFRAYYRGRKFQTLGVATAVLAGTLFAVPVSAQNKINTVAGGGNINNSAGFADVPGPTGAVIDSNGNLFVAAPTSQYVFEMSAAGVVSQFAGKGIAAFFGQPGPAVTRALWNPSGLAVDKQGNVYIADTLNNAIRKVDTTGYLTTIAGTSKPCHQRRCGDNGPPAPSALLNAPQGVAVDSSGNVYIADTGDNRVRVIKAATGKIEAFAGNWNVPACQDPTDPCGDGGNAKLASLNSPAGVAVDYLGNVYIADAGDNRIRMVSAKGKIISTIAGNGTACKPAGFSCGDGVQGGAAAANLKSPQGVTVDHSLNVYVADTGDNRIRIVASSTGTIDNYAGTVATRDNKNNYGFAGDGSAATSALLAAPAGVFVDHTGHVFISDTGNQRVREVKTSGVIITVMGGGNGGDAGAATAAQLADPYAVAVAPGGDYFIADTANNRIRVVSHGEISTFAGNGNAGYSGDGGQAASATLNMPQGVVLDDFGNLFIADTQNRVIRVVSGGIISTFAGNGQSCKSTAACGDGGSALDAQFNSPTTVAVDVAGSVFIADPVTNRVRKVSNGIITTVAGTGSSGYSGDGSPATNAELDSPFGVAIDSSENIYIADSGNNRIRCILGVVGGCGDSQHQYAVGDIMHYAYDGGEAFRGDGGPAISASRWNPKELALDVRGNLFIGGGNNYLVQRIDADTGTIVTVAGNDQQWWWYGFKGDGHDAVTAHLNNAGLAIDGNEDLFIADRGNNRIREVATLVPVVTLSTKSLDFGLVPVGQTSQPLPVVVENTGADDLSIGNIQISGDFAETNNCPIGSGALAPSLSCTINVTFTPTKSGFRKGTVTITDNAPNSPHKVQLQGTGQ